MSFTIVVTQNFDGIVVEGGGPATKPTSIERYSQTVDELDIPTLVKAINQKKRGPRPAKKESK